MVLSRPAAPVCDTFAALGPQLQTLAEAVEKDLVGEFQTADIFKALDLPVMILNKTSSQNITENLSTQVFWNTPPQYTNGGGLQQAGLNAIFINARTPSHAFYLGAYVRLATPTNIPVNLKMTVQGTDQVFTTGATRFERNNRYQRRSISTGGEVVLWADMLFYSSQGFCTTAIKHSGGGGGSDANDMNLIEARMWLADLGPSS